MGVIKWMPTDDVDNLLHGTFTLKSSNKRSYKVEKEKGKKCECVLETLAEIIFCLLSIELSGNIFC